MHPASTLANIHNAALQIFNTFSRSSSNAAGVSKTSPGASESKAASCSTIISFPNGLTTTYTATIPKQRTYTHTPGSRHIWVILQKPCRLAAHPDIPQTPQDVSTPQTILQACPIHTSNPTNIPACQCIQAVLQTS